MSSTYSVMVVGTGKRGLHHAQAFATNPRFKVVGLCDLDAARLEAAAAKVGGGVRTGTDAAALAKDLRPDVFCFCTMPNLRLPMIRAGVDAGAKMIAFEKPVALSSVEASQMRDLLRSAGVKAVVSHQHRYGAHYRKVLEIVRSGALGRVHTVYGTATGWMTHMLSHLVDYSREYAGSPAGVWAMAQAAGRGKLQDNHPSPDYIAGVVQYANGVRGIYECGAGAPDQPEVAKWWGKNRIGAQGTEGFAEVLTNGGWRAVTKRDGWQSGDGAMNYDLDMPPYVADIAAALDGTQAHPCDFESAWIGAEIVFALQRSVAEGGQVALPLADGTDEQALLRACVHDRPVLVSADINRKEYGLA